MPCQDKAPENVNINRAADSPPGSVAELAGALAGPRPSEYFRDLLKKGLLKARFPEIAAMVGVPQHPDYHPEGDVFEHTMIVLDRVAGLTGDLTLRFAALTHDMGKTLTPDEDRIWHKDHECHVAAILDKWNARTPFPDDWLAAGKTVGELHMIVPRINSADEIVAVLGKALPSPVAVKDLVMICAVDDMTGTKPPLDLTRFLALFHAAYTKIFPPGWTKKPAANGSGKAARGDCPRLSERKALPVNRRARLFQDTIGPAFCPKPFLWP